MELHAFGSTISLRILNSLDHELGANKNADNQKVGFIFFKFFT